MYNKLLISAGGGIIDPHNRVEQNDNVTIAIALGGTGIDCLSALKKKIYDRLTPNNENAANPLYNRIKLLAIDVDQNDIKKVLTDGYPNNSIDILNLGCTDVLKMVDSTLDLKTDPRLSWFDFEQLNHFHGDVSSVGGTRQIARLLMILKSHEFVQKTTNAISNALRECSRNTEVNIHILTGMSGSTGSGILLDVCYLTRYVLDTLGVNANISGFFVMPDVTIDRFPTLPNDIKDRMKSAATASLTELDYCMSFGMSADEWKQTYSGFSIKTSKAPVDVAYLISSHTTDMEISKYSYNDVVHTVSEYIISFLAASKDYNDFRPSYTCFTSSFPNISCHVVPKYSGACHNYNALGVSRTALPCNEITTYLASKIFEGFGRIDRQLPSENEIDLFVKNTGLSYEEISRALNAKVPAVPIYAVDTKALYEQTIGHFPDPDTIPQVLGQMRDSIAKINGVIVENKKKMLENLESSNVDNISYIASMITRVKNKLMEISGQSDKGPYYASAILHNVNAVDLQNKIDGCIARNSENLSMARADMISVEREMACAFMDLQKSIVFTRRRYCEKYIYAVNKYFKQCVKIDFLTTLEDLLVEFKKQVNDLYIKHFAIFDAVMHNLEATFESNRTALSNPIAADNGYAVKLITIQDIQESLDASVKKMRMDDLIHNFMNYMLSNPEIWIAQDENKIAHAVSTFFLAELNEFTGRTMLDYLKIKYQTDDPQIIADKVYNDIVMPMYDRAKLLWSSSNYSYRDVYYSPSCSPEISAAVSAFAYNKQIIHRFTQSEELTVIKASVGIALFSYKEIEQYTFCMHNISKVEEYEWTLEKNIDLKNEYSIIPFSRMSQTDCHYENYKMRNSIVQKAKDLGIYIKRDVGGYNDYIIKEFDELKINDMVYIGNYSSEDLPVYNEIVLTNAIIGERGYEDTVADDIVIGSNVIFKIVSKQVELLERLYKSN